MHVIGISGGVASGKSLAAQRLQQLGAVVLDADAIAHELLDREEIRDEIRRVLGPQVFDAAGHVDRAALGKIVFAQTPEGARQRTLLEQITHPPIKSRLQRRIAELAASDTVAAVLDVPLLLEVGWGDLCDRIVFVDAPHSQRVARAATRGWTEADLDAREAAQESLDVKRRRADVVIDNSGSKDRVFAQIDEFWRSLG